MPGMLVTQQLPCRSDEPLWDWRVMLPRRDVTPGDAGLRHCPVLAMCATCA